MEYEIGESTEFLVAKLKKNFPGFKLRPHTKLLFIEENMKLLEQGSKKATIRYEKATIRYPSSDKIPLIESSLKDPEHRKDMGMIEIQKMVVKKFGELNEEDAAQTGVYIIEKMKTGLKKVFGPMGKNEYVSIYYFK